MYMGFEDMSGKRNAKKSANASRFDDTGVRQFSHGSSVQPNMMYVLDKRGPPRQYDKGIHAMGGQNGSRQQQVNRESNDYNWRGGPKQDMGGIRSGADANKRNNALMYRQKMSSEREDGSASHERERSKLNEVNKRREVEENEKKSKAFINFVEHNNKFDEYLPEDALVKGFMDWHTQRFESVYKGYKQQQEAKHNGAGPLEVEIKHYDAKSTGTQPPIAPGKEDFLELFEHALSLARSSGQTVSSNVSAQYPSVFPEDARNQNTVGPLGRSTSYTHHGDTTPDNASASTTPLLSSSNTSFLVPTEGAHVPSMYNAKSSLQPTVGLGHSNQHGIHGNILPPAVNLPNKGHNMMNKSDNHMHYGFQAELDMMGGGGNRMSMGAAPPQNNLVVVPSHGVMMPPQRGAMERLNAPPDAMSVPSHSKSSSGAPMNRTGMHDGYLYRAKGSASGHLGGEGSHYTSDLAHESRLDEQQPVELIYESRETHRNVDSAYISNGQSRPKYPKKNPIIPKINSDPAPSRGKSSQNRGHKDTVGQYNES